jgi:hypothetical protein
VEGMAGGQESKGGCGLTRLGVAGRGKSGLQEHQGRAPACGRGPCIASGPCHHTNEDPPVQDATHTINCRSQQPPSPWTLTDRAAQTQDTGYPKMKRTRPLCAEARAEEDRRLLYRYTTALHTAHAPSLTTRQCCGDESLLAPKSPLVRLLELRPTTHPSGLSSGQRDDFSGDRGPCTRHRRSAEVTEGRRDGLVYH